MNQATEKVKKIAVYQVLRLNPYGEHEAEIRRDGFLARGALRRFRRRRPLTPTQFYRFI